VRTFVTIAALAVLAACGGDASVPTAAGTPGEHHAPQAAPPDTVPPRVRDLGVTFAPYDATSHLAGAFDFTIESAVGPLGGFGRRVPDPQGNMKSLPTYDYFVATGTVVRAPFDGIVSWVRFQSDSKDYEVLVSKSSTSPWWFDYDHVSKVLVDSGTAVRTGDPIAVVQTIAVQGRAYGFTELMVGSYATRLAYCPLDLAEPAVADSLSRVVARLYADWRAAGHGSPDATAMVTPGCYTHIETT
jgi:hypothetical protein